MRPYPPEIFRLIQIRAYEIWEFTQKNHLYLICDCLGNPRFRTAQDDWLDAEVCVLAEDEMASQNAQCPRCKGTDIAKADDHCYCNACGYYWGVWMTKKEAADG